MTNYFKDAHHQEVRILTHRRDLTAHFKRLNMLWLREFFEVEPYDQKILDDPQTHIIDAGGQIFYAQMGDRIIGTAALYKDKTISGIHQYEFTKMGVEPGLRGQGVGRKLLKGVIDYAKNNGTDRLFVLTNSSLAPATKLYISSGFSQIPVTIQDQQKYNRANVKLEMWLDESKKTLLSNETIQAAA